MTAGVLVAAWLLFYCEIATGAAPNKEIVSIKVEIIGKFGQYRATRRTNYRQIIQSITPAHFTTVSIPEYSWSKISGIKMRINSKSMGKEYRDVSNDVDQDVFLSDDFVHGLFYPTAEMKVGDTLCYEYTEEVADLAHLPLFNIYNLHEIESYELAVKYPKGVKVTPRIVFVRDSVPVKITDDDQGNLSITMAGVAKAEPLVAYPLNAWHALISLDVLADGKLQTTNRPREFVDWYRRDLSLEPTLDTSTHFSAHDSIGTFPTPRLQLSAIHDWVRTHIRYVADMSHGHSHFPHKPSEVLALRYGDCKDRAFLVCAMARQFGLTVRMGLVASTFRPDLGGLTHLFHFDHVICYYTDSSGELFFDPTARYHAFDDLPSAIVEHRALVLDPDNPREVTVISTDTTNDLEVSLDAHIDSLRSARAVITVRKDHLAAIRTVRLEQTGVSLDELYRDILEDPLRPIRLQGFRVVEDSSRFIRLSATADVSSLVVVSPSKVYLPETVFPIIKPEIGARAKDSLPLYYDYQTATRLTLDLRGTGGGPTDTTSAWGDQQSGRSMTSLTTDSLKTVHYTHEVHRFKKILQGEQKAAHLTFCAHYVQVRKPQFALKREHP